MILTQRKIRLVIFRAFQPNYCPVKDKFDGIPAGSRIRLEKTQTYQFMLDGTLLPHRLLLQFHANLTYPRTKLTRMNFSMEYLIQNL